MLAEEAVTAQAIEDGLRCMLPKGSLCPACQLIASIERTAAHELARRLGAEISSNPAVCVFHLYSVLRAGPELKAAAVLEEAPVSKGSQRRCRITF